MDVDNIDKLDGCEDATTSIKAEAHPMSEVPAANTPNLSSYDQKHEENDEFCDGPVTRTRSKIGGQNPMDDIPPSFLVQIPHYAYKQEKNKKCQVCGKHARTPSDLLRHMRVHTGERPFPCVACEKTFKCKRSQLTHQYLSHAIKDGLSEHRLDVLDNRKVKRSSSKLKECFSNLQMPTLIDQIRNNSYIKQDVYPTQSFEQDEDTEIVAGEEAAMASESQISFGGLFGAQKENSDMGLKCQETGSLNVDEREACQNVNGNMLSILNSCHNTYLAMKDTNEQMGENCLTESNNLTGASKTDKEYIKKVPILRIKTHKCTHCKRQFRSIYTLRYHLRSMHDEKVYLSPALESRLKKRRWIPPHVRLQKSKISMTGTHSKREHAVSVIKHSHNELNYSLTPSFPTDPIDQKFNSSPLTERMSDHSKSEDAVDLHINKDLTLEIKKEKMDSYEDEVNNNIIPNSGNECNNRTLRDILSTSGNDVKQMSHFTGSLPNSSLNVTGTSFNMNNSGTTNSSNPFVIPPHIFFPSTPAADEGLMNEKPISWESLQVTSESVLITKLEAVHPGTQQKYVLYKCGLCGKAFASLRVICAHLAVHNDASKDRDCEKCGASFKWKNELDTHLECHQVSDRKYLPTSPYLPSYYVNPFPIPVVTPTEQSVMSATGLLPYPFFPMPQQMPPMMQPGFFPFFAAALQPHGEENVMRNGNRSPAESSKNENYDDKNLVQGCTFQCKLCPKTFDRIFSLQRHERIHSGVKACFCKVCGRGFSELRNLRHHIIRFHADSAQREPLPYRRRPNRIRNVSSSQKLVSFLKKTAVRILNSMGQSKLDSSNQNEVSSSSVKIQTEEVKESENKEPENLSTNVTTSVEQNLVQSEPVTSMPQLYDATSHTTQSHSMQDLSEIPPPRLSPGAIVEKDVKPSVNEKSKNGTVELLQDPKRSLLGNRRKGRPFKLSTSSYSTLNLGGDDLLFSMTDGSFMEKQNDAITTSNLLQAAEALSGCMKTELGIPQLNFFNPEPLSNEPIDMRFPVAKEKTAALPPPISTFETSESLERTSVIEAADNKMGVGISMDKLHTSQSLKLPPDIKDSFESRCLFPCSYCHKSFNSLTDLNRHMSFHADIRPFKCPYCSYCSRTNSQLKVHMMRHEGIKHYMCQICNYNGVTQSDLNRHLKTRTHLLRSRNVCACCGTGFHTRSLSDEHFKSCHLSMNSGNQEQKKVPQETSTNKSSSNRNRVTRLKQFRTPEDKIKNDFYQKLCDLNNMGLTLGDFLQQSSALNLEK